MRRPALSRCRKAGVSGFTLLEILVALVVLGFLMAGLAEGVRGGLALWHAQTRRLDRSADLDATQRALRRLLSRIENPMTPRLLGWQTVAPFKGDAGRLSFLGRLPSGLGRTRRARLTLEREGRRFVLLWAPLARGIGQAPQPASKTVLLRHIKAVDFAYWGAPTFGRPAAWQSRWHSPLLPAVIRVRLVFPKGDPRRWPDLMVAPQF